MYTEIVVNEVHYFVPTKAVEGETVDVSSTLGHRELTVMSDFVTKGTNVIKCRYDLNEMARVRVRNIPNQPFTVFAYDFGGPHYYIRTSRLNDRFVLVREKDDALGTFLNNFASLIIQDNQLIKSRESAAEFVRNYILGSNALTQPNDIP